MNTAQHQNDAAISNIMMIWTRIVARANNAPIVNSCATSICLLCLFAQFLGSDYPVNKFAQYPGEATIQL
jgi:hypothetical protein